MEIPKLLPVSATIRITKKEGEIMITVEDGRGSDAQQKISDNSSNDRLLEVMDHLIKTITEPF